MSTQQTRQAPLPSLAPVSAAAAAPPPPPPPAPASKKNSVKEINIVRRPRKAQYQAVTLYYPESITIFNKNSPQDILSEAEMTCMSTQPYVLVTSQTLSDVPRESGCLTWLYALYGSTQDVQDAALLCISSKRPTEDNKNAVYVSGARVHCDAGTFLIVSNGTAKFWASDRVPASKAAPMKIFLPVYIGADLNRLAIKVWFLPRPAHAGKSSQVDVCAVSVTSVSKRGAIAVDIKWAV